MPTDQAEKQKKKSMRMNTSDAAEFLGVSEQTLCNWRSMGREDAPPYYKIGSRILYDHGELLEFMRSHRIG